METRDFNLCKTSRDTTPGLCFSETGKVTKSFFQTGNVCQAYVQKERGRLAQGITLHSSKCFNDEDQFRLKQQDGCDGIQFHLAEWPFKSPRCIKITSQLLLRQYDLPTNDRGNRRNRGHKSALIQTTWPKCSRSLENHNGKNMLESACGGGCQPLLKKPSFSLCVYNWSFSVM